MTISSGARKPDPEDLCRKQERAEADGHTDRDHEPLPPPRRWRPLKKLRAATLAPPKVS